LYSFSPHFSLWRLRNQIRTLAKIASACGGILNLLLRLDHLPQLADLAKRYTDQQPDLADLCLIRMSELHPHHRVITADKDFRVYRRNKREVIPLICPPGI
jgi:hypothetical protein